MLRVARRTRCLPTVLALTGWAGSLSAQDLDPIAERIRSNAFASQQAAATLGTLTDGFGHRLPGSEAHRAAAAWLVDRLNRYRLKVREETIELAQGWQRGRAVVEIIEPAPRRLPACFASVWSLPTHDLETGEARPVAGELVLADGPRDDVDGRIVLVDTSAVPFGARAEHPFPGAAAVLVDSGRPWAVGATGCATWAASGIPAPMPTVFLPHTEATRLRRFAGGDTEVRIAIDVAATLGEAVAIPEVVADLPGEGEHADEIVWIAAPFDSFDLGDGAATGAATATLLEAARLLSIAGKKPARTIRFVLLGASCLGLGSAGYAARHAEELDRHVTGLVIPAGGGAPRGLGLALQTETLPLAEQWFAPVTDLGLTDVGFRTGETDLPVAMQDLGVPVFEFLISGAEVALVEGTRADTLDRVLADDLRIAACAVATVAWRMAAGEAPGRFQR